MKTIYKATGHVFGRLWGGGIGAYPARMVKGENREEVKKTLLEMLNDGSLDSGMGFQELLAATIEIKEIEHIEKDGKVYSHSSFEDITIGNENFIFDIHE